jgi:hypothetical protein
MNRLCQQYDIIPIPSSIEQLICRLEQLPDALLFQMFKEQVHGGGGGEKKMGRMDWIHGIVDRVSKMEIELGNGGFRILQVQENIANLQLDNVANEVKDRLSLIKIKVPQVEVFIEKAAAQWIYAQDFERLFVNEVVSFELQKALVFLFEDLKFIVDMKCGENGFVQIELVRSISKNDWKLFFEFILGKCL